MAYQFPLNGGRINASIGGNSTSAGAGYSLISTGTMMLAGGNNITLSQNGQSISVNAPSQSSMAATGVVNISLTGSTISIGAPAYSAGISTIGNTSGTTGFATNQLVFAGGNNITLSQSTGVSGNTLSIIGASGGGGGVAVAGGGATITSGTANFNAAGGALTIASGANSSLNFSVPATSSLSVTGALNIATSGSTVSIGAPAFSAGISSNSTVSNQLILAAGSNISLSQSTNASGATVSISGGGGLNISAGTASANLGSVTFANSNGVSFGLSGSAVTASIANPAYGVAFGNSQTAFSAGTVSLLEGSGALTIGSATNTAGTQIFNISVPQKSVLSGVNGVSLSTNGNTIMIGGSAGSVGVFNASYYYPSEASPKTVGQQGQGTLHFQPLEAPNVSFDRMVFPVAFSGDTNSTASISMSMYAGIYTKNFSTLSLLTSFSTSNSLVHSGTANSSQNIGLKQFTMGATSSLSQGEYWMGIVSQTASGGANASLSQILASRQGSNFAGLWGQAPSATNQLVRGLGVYSASTAGIPSSVAFSQINGTNSQALNPPTFYMVSNTI